MEYFMNADGRDILKAVVAAISANKAYLGDIDGMIGDGDHGANMNKGFCLFAGRHLDKEITFTDGLCELGTVLMQEIDGSMGPIYGTVFTEMSSAAEGASEIDLTLFIKMLDAGIDGLFDIVDARVGDKTLVDTLVPARDALSHSLDAGKSFSQALSAMKQAAEKGMESTKNMIAKYGRSSRLGERSRGVLDAGAASCCIILNAMADGMTAAMKP